jgi:hypothetical protein
MELQEKSHIKPKFRLSDDVKTALFLLGVVLGFTAIFILCHFAVGDPFDSAIRYKSTNNSVVEPTHPGFGAKILYNIYPLKKGVIQFCGEITRIAEKAFEGNCKLESIIVPEEVKSIGQDAFKGCVNLKEVTISGYLKEIESEAFMDCNNLEEIDLPYSITQIGDRAFYGCESLTEISIPEDIVKIGKEAFYGCRNLESFSGELVSKDERCLVINDILISFAPAGLDHYTIPNEITEIADRAFCSYELKSVTIPQSITAINPGAFLDCDRLERFKGKFASRDGRCLVINETLVAFAPYGVRDYTIPDGVAAIEKLTFLLSGLKNVTLPASVIEIGSAAFSGCLLLDSVTIANGNTRLGEHVFGFCDDNLKIRVPMEYVEHYKSAENWSEYADKIVGY